MPNVFGYLTQASADPNLLLTGVLLPFLLIFVVLWGVLQMARIFGNTPEAKKINMVVAVVITIFAAFTDAWGILVGQLAAFQGIFVFVVFFAVFIIGAIIWAVGRTMKVYHSQDFGSVNNIKSIDKILKDQYKKLRDAEYRGDQQLAQSIMKQISELEQKKEAMLNLAIRRHT